MTWPTKRQLQRQMQRQRQWQLHLENTFKGQSVRLLTFETFDQSGEESWQRQRQRHLENIIKEWLKILVTFETSDQSDEETLPGWQKDKECWHDHEATKSWQYFRGFYPLKKLFFQPQRPVWVLQKLRIMRGPQLKFYENCGLCGSLISFTPPL